MKLAELSAQNRLLVSPPARAAWIETLRYLAGIAIGKVAAREGGVD